MAVKVTAQELADRWTAGLSGATQQISDGIDRVTVSPTSQAAKAKTKMLQNLTAAVNSGKWEAGLNRVSLADWQTAMKEKGVPRIAQGAAAANGKMAQFAAQLIPYENQLQATINNMPSLTLQDSIARASAWITGMSKFVKR